MTESTYTCPRCRAVSHNPNDLANRYCGWCHQFEDATLTNFTIYSSPADYPGKYVVRRWRVVRGSPEPVPDPQPLAVVDTLEEARRAVPAHLTCIPRWPGDVPCVVEVWL